MNRNTLKTILKVVISILVFGGLYYQLFENKDVSQLWASFLDRQQTFNYSWFIIACGMVFINWGVETVKWRALLRGIQSISFTKAFSAVLSGVALAVITPGRIGEYGGRIWFLDNQVRLKGIVVTLVGSLGQILATILFGAFGITYWLLSFPDLTGMERWLYVSAIIVVAVVATIAFYNMGWIARLTEKIKWLKSRNNIVQAIKIFSYYSRHKLNELLLYSLLRFVVYAIQFVFLLWAFQIEISFLQSFLLVSCIFIGQFLLPVPAIAELGTRGNLALYFFGMLSANNLSILSASITLWIINLIIPAVFGAFIFLIRK